MLLNRKNVEKIAKGEKANPLFLTNTNRRLACEFKRNKGGERVGNSSVGRMSPSVEDGPESSSPFPAKKSMLILTYSIFCTGKDKKTPIKYKYIQLYIPTPFPQKFGIFDSLSSYIQKIAQSQR